MRISNEIYLVGSGNFGISHMTDCNIYVVGSEKKFALIDTGSGLQPEKILENITKEGIKESWIKYLILTHAHWDHAGGCLALANAINCKICAYKSALPILKKNPWRGTPIENISNNQGIKVDIEIDNNLTIDLGRTTLKFIHTPGHSPDGISIVGQFNCGLSLFCGDTVMAGGKIGVISNDTNLNQYATSIRTLYQLKPTALFPGHGTFTLTNSDVHLRISYERMKSSWYEVFPAPTPFNPSWWINSLKDQ